MLNDSLYSSANRDWETPSDLFYDLNREFDFTLDPCADEGNAKCATFFTEADDGLTKDWSKHTVYMSPPYGRTVVDWVQKAKDEADRGATVVCLLPARTDTRWWHDYVMRSAEIRLCTRRLTFEGASNKATFPAAIVVFRPGKHQPVLGSQKV